MNIQPVTDIIELYDFFYYNVFDKNEQDYLNYFGVDDIVNLIWENNKILYSIYGMNLMFFAIRDGNNKPTGLVFSTFINDKVIEFGSFKVMDEVNKIFITRAFVWYLNYLDSIDEIIRKQSTILVDNKGSLNIHKRFGYEIEGILHKYDGVNDYYMVAKYE